MRRDANEFGPSHGPLPSGGHSVESTLNNAKEEQNETSVGCERLFHEDTERVGAIESKRAALHITKTPV